MGDQTTHFVTKDNTTMFCNNKREETKLYNDGKTKPKQSD